MKPQLTVLTLGVDDLDRSLRFYRDGLGLPTRGLVGQEFEHGAVAFFELQAGLRLAIWPRKSIAHDSGVPEGPKSATEVTLGHNVATRAEVDILLRHARETFWGGYAGYFADPDGHLWEVVWNPQLILAD
jgi:catechol 2,3-dioxygenase-like lactoylglutathione lyase family enzyme